MIEITENIDLKEMTTFGISAPCGRLVEFSNPQEDLPELNRRGLLKDALVIGGGSNLLFADREAANSLTVVHPVASEISINGFEPDGSVVFKVDAGVVLDDFCAETAKEGYWGMENLSGIPGQIGGAAVQNVGAYGTEFKDVVESVTCYDIEADRFVTLTNEECRYGYRDSVFKHPDESREATGNARNRLIVCFVTIRLSRAYSPNLAYKGLRDALAAADWLTPRLVRDTVLRIRDGKLPDPKQVGSAGSFFKNPVVEEYFLEDVMERWERHPGSEGIPLQYHRLPDGKSKLSAAWLIDKAGCKGMTFGGASLWPSQPLVIVNAEGKATGTDIVGLEHEIGRRVYDTFGIWLEPEVIHI